MPNHLTLVSKDGQWKAELHAWKSNWFIYASIGGEATLYHGQQTKNVWGNTVTDWVQTPGTINISNIYKGSGRKITQSAQFRNRSHAELKIWSVGLIKIDISLGDGGIEGSPQSASLIVDSVESHISGQIGDSPSKGSSTPTPRSSSRARGEDGELDRTADRLPGRQPSSHPPAGPGRSAADRGLSARLGGEQLDLLAAEHGFDDLSLLTPDRGDAGRLCEIAWYGSAVADIASSGDGGADPDAGAHLAALRTGGLFNVAVALVDSVVDRRRDARAELLAVALAPPALRDRMLLDRPLDSQGRGGEIVALMDVVLRDVAERWRQDQQLLTEAHGLLTRMYVSEMHPGASRRDAKLLPLTFIGVVSDPARRPVVRETIQAISRLAGLLDDWQDLGEDLVAGRANAFLHERDFTYATSAARTLIGAQLIARPRTASADIAGQVRTALLSTVAAARRASGVVEAKTHAFLRRLLMP